MAKIARPEIEIEELTGEGSGILKKNALLYGKELGEHCRMYKIGRASCRERV